MTLEEIYKKLAAEATEYRKAAGFNPTNRNNLGTKLACVYSELVELEEAIEQDDIRKIEAELADVALYALMMLNDLVGRDWCLRSPRHEQNKYRCASELTKPLRKRTRAVFEFWRRGLDKDTTIALELVVKDCIDLASTLDFDLAIAIMAKAKFNKTRERRHGNKHADT